MKFKLYLIAAVIFSGCAKITPQKSHVLLVSFDGFRHDYVERFDAQNFKEFINKGSAAEGLIPSFPSKTFPNHYSIVTGLYPGNHGLVANTFYDNVKDATYSIGNRELVEDPFYYGGTPLWQLTQENGVKSASYFWVGSEAPIKGNFPDFYKIYDGRVPNNDRVDTVIDWLNLSEKKRPRFISLYFSLVDTQGHRFGPNSEELKTSVLDADAILGYLMERLENVDLPINVILVSDHGMKEVKAEDKIDFDVIRDLTSEDAVVIDDKILPMVYLPETEIEETYGRIKKLESNFVVYKKGDTPEKWHFSENYRIGDLVLVPNPGYAFRTRPARSLITGEHGYDPYTTPEMQGILYARGPNINSGVKTGTVENVHIYPLITKILGFKNPVIDGDFKSIKAFYKK